MLKGIVMELSDKSAVIMTQDGRFERIPRRGLPLVIAIGQEIEAPSTGQYVLDQMKRYRFVSAAAIFCFIVLASFGLMSGIGGETKVVAYVTMDINPSVEVGLNAAEKIVVVRGINDDGWELIAGLSYKGLTLDEFSQLFVDRLEENHYLDNEEVNILISSTIVSSRAEFDDAELSLKIEHTVIASINKKQTDTPPKQVVITAVAAPVEVRNEAVDKGVSTGKMAALIMSQIDDKPIELDELMSKPIKQLFKDHEDVKEQLEDAGKAVKDQLKDQLKQLKEVEKQKEKARKELEKEKKQQEKDKKQQQEKDKRQQEKDKKQQDKDKKQQDKKQDKNEKDREKDKKQQNKSQESNIGNRSDDGKGNKSDDKHDDKKRDDNNKNDNNKNDNKNKDDKRDNGKSGDRDNKRNDGKKMKNSYLPSVNKPDKSDAVQLTVLDLLTNSRQQYKQDPKWKHGPKQHDSNKQDPKKQDPKKQDPKKQDPKKQDPKKQDPKKQDPKKQDPKKQEQPKKYDPKQSDTPDHKNQQKKSEKPRKSDRKQWIRV